MGSSIPVRDLAITLSKWKDTKILFLDVKPDNTLLRIPNVDAVIDETLEEEPSTTYPPRIEPDLSPDPIITVLSQPIPFTEDSVDPKKMEACLMDFGECE